MVTERSGAARGASPAAAGAAAGPGTRNGDSISCSEGAAGPGMRIGASGRSSVAAAAGCERDCSAGCCPSGTACCCCCCCCCWRSCCATAAAAGACRWCECGIRKGVSRVCGCEGRSGEDGASASASPRGLSCEASESAAAAASRPPLVQLLAPTPTCTQKSVRFCGAPAAAASSAAGVPAPMLPAAAPPPGTSQLLRPPRPPPTSRGRPAATATALDFRGAGRGPAAMGCEVACALPPPPAAAPGPGASGLRWPRWSELLLSRVCGRAPALPPLPCSSRAAPQPTPYAGGEPVAPAPAGCGLQPPPGSWQPSRLLPQASRLLRALQQGAEVASKSTWSEALEPKPEKVPAAGGGRRLRRQARQHRWAGTPAPVDLGGRARCSRSCGQPQGLAPSGPAASQPQRPAPNIHHPAPSTHRRRN